MEQQDITINYSFDLANGTKKRFLIRLDPLTSLMKTSSHSKVEWTRLTAHQCSCCRLSADQTAHCPVAVNIADLVTAFKDILSHESCSVSCITTERTTIKETIVQDGLSSIMGIIMATSGCPTLDILRPMARFHLPFASVDESMFRIVSVYLLRQYFIEKDGREPDFQLSRIKQYWKQIERVNEGILNRIRYAAELDADKNAIVILNCLAQILPMEIDEDLNSLRPYFSRPDTIA
ncbi:DUF6901 family protein [Desulfofustis limnaeus]|jgi:hypothetical protein|uniref:Uncharacterized protein n=1 Tax=Desulfofustis limnaeus TaxID=2740163 RepID=A0ABM7W893_9BACT|nr:hypothetical protein [Desulfofustis limnaeus]MDX9894478.1 hypothetical protein [Desulfofustis sp.]BDD87110.1 hypothetical protein DPPLL_14750 [Desulfofustis limnaeus]